MSSLDFGNRRTPRNFAAHLREPAATAMPSGGNVPHGGFEFIPSAHSGGYHPMPLEKKPRFPNQWESSPVHSGIHLRFPAHTNLPSGFQPHHAPPPPPPHVPIMSYRDSRIVAVHNTHQTNKSQGVVHINPRQAAAVAAAATVSTPSDSSASASPWSPPHLPILAADAGEIPPPPPPPPLTSKSATKSPRKRAKRPQQQSTTGNSASQSPASRPSRRSARASPAQGAKRRNTKRRTNSRSAAARSSVAAALPPATPFDPSEGNPTSTSSARTSRKRARPPAAARTTRSTGRTKRVRTGGASTAAAAAESLSGGGGFGPTSTYGLRHKSHRPHSRAAASLEEVEQPAAPSLPSFPPVKGAPLTSALPSAEVQADLREIVLRGQSLRDVVSTAPKTPLSELTLGERDFSDLLSPSARVVTAPNSRARALVLRKHPRDKFGTHQQVHVTDVVARRKWVALIVGMNETQIELLDGNNTRCKILVKDIERDRFVVTRPAPQLACAPGHHTHHPSAAAWQRAFR